MNKTISTRLGLTVILAAFLLSVSQSSTWAASSLPDCHNVNLRTVAVGFRCSVENWWIFERVERSGFGEAWRAPDGVIWGDRITIASQFDGMQICAKLGGTLPSKQDFHNCNDGGRRIVLPNFHGEYYWSGSFNEGWDNADAYNCNGGSAQANRYNPCYAVRCVAR